MDVNATIIEHIEHQLHVTESILVIFALELVLQLLLSAHLYHYRRKLYRTDVLASRDIFIVSVVPFLVFRTALFGVEVVGWGNTPLGATKPAPTFFVSQMVLYGLGYYAWFVNKTLLLTVWYYRSKGDVTSRAEARPFIVGTVLVCVVFAIALLITFAAAASIGQGIAAPSSPGYTSSGNVPANVILAISSSLAAFAFCYLFVRIHRVTRRSSVSNASSSRTATELKLVVIVCLLSFVIRAIYRLVIFNPSFEITQKLYPGQVVLAESLVVEVIPSLIITLILYKQAVQIAQRLPLKSGAQTVPLQVSQHDDYS